MLQQLVCLGVIVLVVSSGIYAKTYDFSWYPDGKPPELTYERDGQVRAWLTHGDFCDYQYAGDKFYEATAHCRRSAGLNCKDQQCLCLSLTWDPEVQYVSKYLHDQDKDQILTGKCVSVKNEGCTEDEDTPGIGRQCAFNLTCVHTDEDKRRRRRRRGAAYGKCQ